jgi:chromosome partitioning protein
MGRSVAVVCPKGGVGKTTVAVNLASALADKGYRCLLVGVDPQCGLVSSFGRDRFDIDNGLLDLFDPDGDIDAAVQPSGIENLDFITSNVWSREEEQELLQGAASHPERVAALIARQRERYDYIFLDCPPNLGVLTGAALEAADECLVPLQAEELPYRALPRLFDGLDEMRRQGRHVPELMGIVLNQVDPRTRLAGDVTGRVREEYEGLVFETAIPRSVRLAEVAQRGRPVNHFNRAGNASAAFASLAEEVLAAALKRRAAAGSAGESATPGRQVAESRAAEPAGEPLRARGAWAAGLGDGADSDEERDDGDDRFVSFDEMNEDEDGDGGSRHRPSLDDYDGSSEDERYH